MSAETGQSVTKSTDHTFGKQRCLMQQIDQLYKVMGWCWSAPGAWHTKVSTWHMCQIWLLRAVPVVYSLNFKGFDTGRCIIHIYWSQCRIICCVRARLFNTRTLKPITYMCVSVFQRFHFDIFWVIFDFQHILDFMFQNALKITKRRWK